MSEIIDTPEPEEDPAPARRALRWTAWAIAFATLGLVVCNAEAGRSWSEGLPPSAVSQPIGVVCEGWANLTRAAHLSLPRDMIRGWWNGRHEMKWNGAGKAAPGNAPGRAPDLPSDQR